MGGTWDVRGVYLSVTRTHCDDLYLTGQHERPMRSGAPRPLDRGQSELVGTVLLVGIVIVGVGAVVAVGTTALETAREDARTSNVERAMAQFDSEAGMVALGGSDARNVRLVAGDGGTYDVDADAGWLRVRHHNHSAGGNTAVLTNATLGVLAYENDDTRIVYQAGGVWRNTGHASRMLAPPPFHYRGATLTLPIITVDGADSVAGATAADIATRGRATRVFPNASAPGYGNASYRNPVDTGTVTVTVHGDHYVAWANYFGERTAGDVSIDHADRTATLRLTGERETETGGDGVFLYVTEREIEIDLD
jgi:flagellin-like protein